MAQENGYTRKLIEQLEDEYQKVNQDNTKTQTDK
jgi:hypothetical protein